MVGYRLYSISEILNAGCVVPSPNEQKGVVIENEGGERKPFYLWLASARGAK
jgi:hypothetical protein